LLPPRRSYLKFLILCVHESSLWTQLFVSTKAIIFDHSHFVHTARTGRLRYFSNLPKSKSSVARLEIRPWHSKPFARMR
jgi:hypothetical protein